MSMVRRRTQLAILVAITVVLVMAVGARFLLWGGDHAAASIGGPFTLIDGKGRTVTDADFHGKFMLIYFGYTYCPDVCPTTLGLMAAAVDKLPKSERERVVPMFITVDPARDTAEVVRDYAAAFSPRMVGLTGSEAQVTAVEKAYKVYAAKAADDHGGYSVDHSSIVYLMGPDGRFVAHFAHGVTVDQMVEGLRKQL